MKAFVMQANKKTSAAFRDLSLSLQSALCQEIFTRLVANMNKMTLMQAALSELIHLEVESQASGNANQASDSINLLWLSSE